MNRDPEKRGYTAFASHLSSIPGYQTRYGKSASPRLKLLSWHLPSFGKSEALRRSAALTERRALTHDHLEPSSFGLATVESFVVLFCLIAARVKVPKIL